MQQATGYRAVKESSPGAAGEPRAEDVARKRRSWPTIQQSAIVYLVAIAASEIVTALVSPVGGVVMHVAVLAMILFHASVLEGMAERGFLLSLAIAPIIRIVSLGMPLGVFPQIWWYALSSIPLFAASIMIIRTIPLSRQEIGLRLPHARPDDWAVNLVVAASGIGLGLIEYEILRPAPLVHSLSVETLAIPSIILLIGTGLLEELIFRGILQAAASRVFRTWPAIIYVSVLFGVLHTGHMSVLDVIFVFFVALYFALVVRRSGSLLGVAIAHGLTNIMLFLVFPLLHL